MQAQTQPALAQVYLSDYACVLKVVFDRVSGRLHWPPTEVLAAARQDAAHACDTRGARKVWRRPAPLPR